MDVAAQRPEPGSKQRRESPDDVPGRASTTVAVQARFCPRCGMFSSRRAIRCPLTARCPSRRLEVQDVDRTTAMIGGAMFLLFLLIFLLGSLRTLA
jgi:hypothetical protein